MSAIASRIDEPNDIPAWFIDPVALWRDTRDLSEAAKGVWMDMLMIMHCAHPRGYLVNRDGSPMDEDTLRRRSKSKESPARFHLLLMEIIERGVCSVGEGRIYCRRMVRERKPGEDLRTVAERYQQNPPAALRGWIRWWNKLAERKLVVGFLTESKPNIELCRAWVRTEKNAEVLGLLARKADIERAIENATFSLKWLSLSDLLSGKNSTGEYKVRRLLEGRYGSADKQSPTLERLSGLAQFANAARNGAR